MLYDILNARTKPSDKALYNIWARKLSSGWTEQEITGSLPLTFDSRAAHTLTDYTVHGTAEGVGVETENLISKNTFLDNCTLITQYERYISFMEFDVEPNTTYWLKTNYYTKRYATWYITNTVGSGVVNSAINGILSEDTPKSATSDSNGKLYVWGRTISTGTDTKIVQDMTDSDYIMLVKSDTAPSTYIPYGYEISITLTDGTNSEDYVLYIGDSKLGENEHLSFAEQKIYKDVSGTLTPTDPPAAFPAITAYAGENTLSSTETVGNVTIKGIIKAVT